jgi:predicted RNase H-like HicB family nuclease
MPVHSEVLDAARRLCRERGGWIFRPDEVVRALPHLNASTVRTHIVSRCCVNAPKNHPHRWAYFRRVARGQYEILPALRRARAIHERKVSGDRLSASGERATASAGRGSPPRRATVRLAESERVYGRRSAAPPSDTVHAVVTRDRGWYVAECLELAVVSQGRTLDELVVNLREAVALHLEGEVPASVGVVAEPRISMTYEVRTSPG